MTLDTFDAVRTVLAVRQFRSDPIPDKVVEQIVEAAHLTASAGNRQTWHFVVVQDPETLKRIGQIATTGPYIAQAPLAVVVVVDPGLFGVADGSRAIQSMILTAWSEDVGSNWVGGPGRYADLKPILGIPEDKDILAILPFGYPAKELGAGKKNRKPLGEVVSREKYSQPYR
jgi:nitroreductase